MPGKSSDLGRVQLVPDQRHVERRLRRSRFPPGTRNKEQLFQHILRDETRAVLIKEQSARWRRCSSLKAALIIISQTEFRVGRKDVTI